MLLFTTICSADLRAAVSPYRPRHRGVGHPDKLSGPLTASSSPVKLSRYGERHVPESRPLNSLHTAAIAGHGAKAPRAFMGRALRRGLV